MSNETLLHQLDALREQYSGQQRAAAALLTALKAVNNAQAKAQKALAAHRGTTDVRPAQEAFAALRLREEAIDPLLPRLQREDRVLAALGGALREAATALRQEPPDVVRLERALGVLAADNRAELHALLPSLHDELDLAGRLLGDEFGYRLREALAAQGSTLGGRAPRFEIGRFELEANFAKRTLILRYGKEVVVPHIPITVEAAVRAYGAATKAVLGRTLDPAAWITQFHEAYQQARRRGAATGARVNLVDCYRELVLLRQGRAFLSEPSKRTISDYPRAHFIADFTEVTDRRRLAHQGQVVRAHSATKSQTDSPLKSMWIVEGDTPYDGRYIADIEWVRD